jgi:hypothetical protein
VNAAIGPTANCIQQLSIAAALRNQRAWPTSQPSYAIARLLFE